jgi:hypothetical protein
LVPVHCDTFDEITHAKETLERTGAKDISSAGEAFAGVTTIGVLSAKKAGTCY